MGMWVRAFMMAFMLLLTLWAAEAAAHTRLVQTSPPHGAVLNHTPRVIAIDFTSPPEPGFTHIELLTPQGWQGLESSAEGKRIKAHMPALAPGNHQLRWSVISRDGHRVSGRLSFTIR
jgi:methionine-rich copper-binding protein CopC